MHNISPDFPNHIFCHVVWKINFIRYDFRAVKPLLLLSRLKDHFSIKFKVLRMAILFVEFTLLAKLFITFAILSQKPIIFSQHGPNFRFEQCIPGVKFAKYTFNLIHFNTVAP